MNRFRLVYAVLSMVVVGLGLASRSPAVPLPPFIAAYTGDTLWALLVFLLLRFLLPQRPTLHMALVALGFAFAIEISQLYHAPWIDAIRQTRIGGLVLGYAFVWRDLGCYTLGIAVGALGDLAVSKAVSTSSRDG